MDSEQQSIYNVVVRPFHEKIAAFPAIHARCVVRPPHPEVVFVCGQITDAVGSVFEVKCSFGIESFDCYFNETSDPNCLKTPFHFMIARGVQNGQVVVVEPFQFTAIYKNYTMDYRDASQFEGFNWGKIGRWNKNTFFNDGIIDEVREWLQQICRLANIDDSPSKFIER